jgi:hypothetical protein
VEHGFAPAAAAFSVVRGVREQWRRRAPAPIANTWQWRNRPCRQRGEFAAGTYRPSTTGDGPPYLGDHHAAFEIHRKSAQSGGESPCNDAGRAGGTGDHVPARCWDFAHLARGTLTGKAISAARTDKQPVSISPPTPPTAVQAAPLRTLRSRRMRRPRFRRCQFATEERP